MKPCLQVMLLDFTLATISRSPFLLVDSTSVEGLCKGVSHLELQKDNAPAMVMGKLLVNCGVLSCWSECCQSSCVCGCVIAAANKVGFLMETSKHYPFLW